MSRSYKKLARQIPDWSKYSKDALFKGRPGVQTYFHLYDESRDRNPEAYPFLATLSEHDDDLLHFFHSSVYVTGSSKDVHYYSSTTLSLPRVRSKKKRTQNHTILVALSNISRRNVRYDGDGSKLKTKLSQLSGEQYDKALMMLSLTD